MIDTKALREKVLDLAIRGKLVPQDPSDEPASILLERIREQKKQMVKEGKLKAKDIKDDSIIFVGDDNLHYEKFANGTVRCIEDEIPFELPEGWAWARLSMVGTTNIGLTYKPSDVTDEGTIVLRSCNIKNGKIDLGNLVRVQTDIRDNQYIENNDILICARNGSRSLVGKCTVMRDIGEKVSFGAFMAVFRSLCFRYVYHFFNTSLFRSAFDNDDSKQINQVTQAILRDTIIPLPPFAEQERIVSTLDEAFALVELVDTETENIEALIKNTKANILDLAIRGKLVPQNPDDEPASVLLDRIRAEKEELIKQGKIKRDKKESVFLKGEDNSYYENLPENWSLTTLGRISKVITKGTTPRGGNVSYTSSGIGFLRAENISGYDKLNLDNLKYVDSQTHTEFLRRSILESEDILITIAGTLGRTAIVTEEVLPLNTNQAVAIVRLVNTKLVNIKYLIYAINSRKIKKALLYQEVAMAIPNLSLENISDCKVPLPPLEEQNRICEAIDEIFTMLDAIQQSLS